MGCGVGSVAASGTDVFDCTRVQPSRNPGPNRFSLRDADIYFISFLSCPCFQFSVFKPCALGLTVLRLLVSKALIEFYQPMPKQTGREMAVSNGRGFHRALTIGRHKAVTIFVHW